MNWKRVALLVAGSLVTVALLGAGLLAFLVLRLDVRGEVERAVNLWGHVVNDRPTGIPGLYRNLGYAALLAGNSALAADVFAKGTTAEPANPAVWVGNDSLLQLTGKSPAQRAAQLDRTLTEGSDRAGDPERMRTADDVVDAQGRQRRARQLAAGRHEVRHLAGGRGLTSAAGLGRRDLRRLSLPGSEPGRAADQLYAGSQRPNYPPVWSDCVFSRTAAEERSGAASVRFAAGLHVAGEAHRRADC